MHSALDITYSKIAPTLTQESNVVSANSLSEIVGLDSQQERDSAPTISERLSAETE
jgi:hypothetical protein